MLGKSMLETKMSHVYLDTRDEIIVDRNYLDYVTSIGGVELDDSKKSNRLDTWRLTYEHYINGYGNFEGVHLNNSKNETSGLFKIDDTVYFYAKSPLHYTLSGYGLSKKGSSATVDYIKGLMELVGKIDNYRSRVIYINMLGFSFSDVTMDDHYVLVYESGGVKHTFYVLLDKNYNVVDVFKVHKDYLYLEESSNNELRYINYISLVNGSFGLLEFKAFNNKITRKIELKKLKIESAVRKVLTSHIVELDGNTCTLKRGKNNLGTFTIELNK